MKARWKVLCQSCGIALYNTEAKKRWDGLIVCKNDWEPKHPLLTPPRPIKDEGTTAARSGFISSEPEDTFVFLCDLYTSMGIAGYGTAGCAQAGTYNMGMSPLPSLTVVPIEENRIIP